MCVFVYEGCDAEEALLRACGYFAIERDLHTCLWEQSGAQRFIETVGGSRRTCRWTHKWISPNQPMVLATLSDTFLRHQTKPP